MCSWIIRDPEKNERFLAQPAAAGAPRWWLRTLSVAAWTIRNSVRIAALGVGDVADLLQVLDAASNLLVVLALTSKLAALHAERLQDPVVLDAMNNVEALCSGLSMVPSPPLWSQYSHGFGSGGAHPAHLTWGMFSALPPVAVSPYPDLEAQ